MRTPRKYGKRWPGPSLLAEFEQANTRGLAVRSEVDPRTHGMPPALEQGRIGSCTANATSRCFRYDSIMDGKDCGELSRTWIYHFEKALEKTLGQGDTGAYGHDAFRVAQHGIPDETLYPYSEDIAVIDRTPPDIQPRAYTLTKPVHSVPQNMTEIRLVLSNYQTIAFGFDVYASFENESWWAGGEMPTPKPGEELLGGHEVLACGYLSHKPNFTLCLNSWGTDFGLGGYFLMPNDYLINRARCNDFRTIVRPPAH